MIRKKIKYFIFALLCILTVQLLFATACYADTPTPTSSGLFNDDILQKMHLFMLRTNQALQSVMMIGDGLMCYAIHVHYHAIEISYLVGSYELFRYPDLGFWLVGAAIYVVGFFMAMSIGMYFVDISFKFGFAIIFMPISIALWPFPPTKNKFGDNLSIIIRNAMLFMLVGIGVSFAVKLINAGILADGAETSFWSAIENDEVEQLTDSFSFFNTHILVVFFSLMYGFKILEGSVNNYLSAFFSDAAFGSESPMHHMGTQLVGMIGENTVKPALSFAKDVATHQTGRAIAGAAKGAGKVFTSEGRAQIGRGIKNGYNKVKGGITTAAHGISFAVQNPRDAAHNTAQYARNQYNKGMQKAGASVNKAVHAAGDFIKAAHDIGTAFAPTPLLRESWRQKQVNAVNKGVDWLTDKVGDKLENAIAHGGGTMKNAAKKYKSKQNAKKLLDDLGAGGEKEQAAREKLTKMGMRYSDVQAAIGATGTERAEAVDKIAGQIQTKWQTDSELKQRIADRKKTAKEDSINQEQADALQSYKQNKEKEIDRKLKPQTDEIADKTKSINDEYNQKIQQAEQQKQAELAAIENDPTLTDQQKERKKAQANLKNEETLAQIEQEYQKAMAPVEKMKREVKQQKLNHLRSHMKENTSKEAYKKWSAQTDKAEKEARAQENRPLQEKEDALRKAEENLKNAQAARITAGANVTAGKKNLRDASKDEKPAAEEELKQAREELQRARDNLLKAQAELTQAQNEYLEAVNKSNMSVAAKTAKNVQVFNKQTNQTPITLAPTRILSTAFRTVFHPQQQIRKVKDNLDAMKNEFQAAEGHRVKLVVKKSGQIVLRGVKDTVDDTGGFLTKMVQKFGEGLADNSGHGRRKSIKEQWEEKNAEEIRQKKEEAERREFFREMDGQ